MMPTDQRRATGALGGKPVPVAMTTRPGGPLLGFDGQLRRSRPRRRGAGRPGSPASLATWSVAVRSPFAVPMKSTWSSHEAPGGSVRSEHGFAATTKSDALAPPMVIAPIRAGMMPVLRMVAGRVVPSDPSGAEPKSIGLGPASTRGGRSRTKTSRALFASAADEVVGRGREGDEAPRRRDRRVRAEPVRLARVVAADRDARGPRRAAIADEDVAGDRRAGWPGRGRKSLITGVEAEARRSCRPGRASWRPTRRPPAVPSPLTAG